MVRVLQIYNLEKKKKRRRKARKRDKEEEQKKDARKRTKTRNDCYSIFAFCYFNVM